MSAFDVRREDRDRHREAVGGYRLALDGRSGVADDGRGGEFALDAVQCRILDACAEPRPRERLDVAREALEPLLAAGLLAADGGLLATVPVRVFTHRLLCLAGPTCAGKTTAVAAALACGLSTFDVGTELERRFGRELAYLDPLPRLAAIGDGDSVLGGLREPIEEALLTGDPLLIDSVKAAGDVPTLARRFPGAGILVLGISAPYELRRRRFHRRNRPGDEASMDVKDGKLLAIGSDRVMRDVDAEIVNDGDHARYEANLARFFTRAASSSTTAFWRHCGEWEWS